MPVCARGPIAERRLRKLTDELYEYTPKRGVTFSLTAKDLVRRLVALGQDFSRRAFEPTRACKSKRRAPQIR